MDTNISSAPQPMPERYNFAEIEPRWQQVWEERGSYHAADSDPRQKMYILQMFPYPSGDLHAGHIRNYVLGDAAARYWRMQGRNVMHPMGFDSFGLPAEQAAIDRGIYPGDWIAQCIEGARRQFKRYGFAFDWEREVVTSDPAYYRWTQWLFIKFYELGLVYRSDFEVNWCPEHGVLANDEVKEGTCWRCDNKVTRRKLQQWCMRTTDYAQELLDNLEALPGWNEAVRIMQRNWIGRSEGTHILFHVPALEHHVHDEQRPDIQVFTTRVDTVYGATFMAIAPDHPLAASMAAVGEVEAELAAFAASCAAEAAQYGPEDEKPKRGLHLNVDAVNPFNGEPIPVYATNYVIASFGTGAVMGVPAHDERDYAFARENGIEIRKVIESEGTAGCTPEKGICINSGPFDGLDYAAAKAAMDAWLAERGLGGAHVQYKLRDWNMSRQRFWGAPIPMIHCSSCGWQPVPLYDLPVRLPETADYSDVRVSPLANDLSWQQAVCPQCGGAARRETDTMTTFMDSAWYFLRFCDPGNEHLPFSPGAVEAWMPVDYYVGGKEHAVGHLLYSRFVTIVLQRAGLLRLARHDHAGLPDLSNEPFRRLLNQGIVYKDGRKMSKSRGNVVSSDSLADEYGADTARLFSFFGGPYDQDLEWSSSGVEGCHRFLKRLWRLAAAVQHTHTTDANGDPIGAFNTSDAHLREIDVAAMRARHRAVAGVSEDIAAWRFNTAIAKLMECLNTLEDLWKQAEGQDPARAFTMALFGMAQLLSPFAPHIAEELWHGLGERSLCCESEWPTHDAAMLLSASTELPVQINGKIRARITVPSAADAASIIAAAKADEHAAQWLAGREIVKELVIPGRLVSFTAK